MKSPTEQQVTESITTLMYDYIRAYVHSDKEAFKSCFHKELCTSIGDRFLSSEDLKSNRSEGHYFDLRKGHWRPPVRTELSVSPLNAVSGLARVRWVFPANPTGTQYIGFSLYLCVSTSKGWKIQLICLPTDSAENLVREDSVYHEWDVERWSIFKDEL